MKFEDKKIKIVCNLDKFKQFLIAELNLKINNIINNSLLLFEAFNAIIKFNYYTNQTFCISYVKDKDWEDLYKSKIEKFLKKEMEI